MHDGNIPDPIWVSGEDEAQLFLLIGRMARFFRTSIEFFLDMDVTEIAFWASVMDQIARQENEANERALRR